MAAAPLCKSASSTNDVRHHLGAAGRQVHVPAVVATWLSSCFCQSLLREAPLLFNLFFVPFTTYLLRISSPNEARLDHVDVEADLNVLLTSLQLGASELRTLHGHAKEGQV